MRSSEWQKVLNHQGIEKLTARWQVRAYCRMQLSAEEKKKKRFVGRREQRAALTKAFQQHKIQLRKKAS